MFKGLRDTIKALNADVSNVANCEKAKKLRKTLLKIGIPMAVLGFGGVFTCFILFTVLSFKNTANMSMDTTFLIPFFLIIPCAIVGGLGATLTSLGLKIVITGYATNLIDEVVGNNCPKCGNAINPDMPFCKKCGHKLVKTCPNCNHENDHESDFCEKCGTKVK